MWPGPYGEWGGRKYMLASLDRKSPAHWSRLRRHLLFAPFRPPYTLEETIGALDSAVRQGKALYVGISSPARSDKGSRGDPRSLGTPCVIHQPSYSMINRWVEADGLLDVLEQEGIGSIAFTPLAQGLLTNKYLKGVPKDSRAAAGKSLDASMLSEANIQRVRKLDSIANRRGQTLAQMAIAWVLRGKRVTSALIGASRPEQVADAVGALRYADFTTEELGEIDRYAVDGGVNLGDVLRIGLKPDGSELCI